MHPNVVKTVESSFIVTFVEKFSVTNGLLRLRPF